MTPILSIIILIAPAFLILQLLLFSVAWIVKYKSLPGLLIFNKRRLKDFGGISLQISMVYIIGIAVLSMAMTQQTGSNSFLAFLPLANGHEGIISISECYLKADDNLSCGLSVTSLLVGAAWAYFQSSWDTLCNLCKELFDIK